MATSRFVPDGAPDGFFLQNDGGRGLEGNWDDRSPEVTTDDLE